MNFRAFSCATSSHFTPGGVCEFILWRHYKCSMSFFLCSFWQHQTVNWTAERPLLCRRCGWLGTEMIQVYKNAYVSSTSLARPSSLGEFGIDLWGSKVPHIDASKVFVLTWVVISFNDYSFRIYFRAPKHSNCQKLWQRIQFCFRTEEPPDLLPNVYRYKVGS